MLNETAVNNGGRWAGTDIVTTTYSVAPIATITEPVASATRAILDLRNSGAVTSYNLIDCVPYATGANNAVITGMRMWGWRRCPGSSKTVVDVWIPKLMFELAMVCGNITGATNGIITASEFFMDTITPVIPAAFSDAPWLQVFSPVGVTADMPAWFRFDAMGHQKVEFTVDLGANATAFNLFSSGY